ESGDEARLQGAFERDRLLAGQIAATRPLAMSEHVAQMAAAMAAAAGAQGLRADLALCRGAAALAGLRSDGEITKEHLLGVAPLVFAHRRLHPPEDAGGKSLEERIEEGLRTLEAEQPRSDGSSGQADPSPHDAHAGSEPPEQGSPPDGTAPGGPDPGDGDSGADPGMNRAFGSAAEEVALFRLAPLSDAKSAGAVASRAGRDRGVVEGRGRVIGDRAFGESGGEIAVAATLRTAALRRARGGGTGAGALVVEEDLRASRRRDRAGRLVVIAVDASKSMRTVQRISETKAAVLSLLIDAYQRRDKVALVTFGGAGARLVLRPTSSPEVAKARLEEVETGGLTPLGPGLRAAREVARPGSAPLVVVITDGRATAAAGDGASPWEEALTEARALRDEQIEVVVIDVEEEKGAMGLALRLAQEMGAGYRRMAELSAGTLERSVRELLG
nr:VWA domain-containing protein [Actinomycetota bacterium]